MNKSDGLTLTDFSGNKLMHYGILGMKWGVRKNQNRSKTKKRLSSKSKAEKKVKESKNAGKLVNSGLFAASVLLAKTSLHVGSEAVKQSAMIGEDASKPEWFVFPLSALGVTGGVTGMAYSFNKIFDHAPS